MLGQLGYLAVVVAILAETAGVPAPGESSLIAAPVLAAAGKLDIVLVVALAALAAIAGDNVGYLLGRRLGRRILGREGGRWRRHRLAVLERGERFFARHGARAVFIGRWLPVARMTSAWLAGTSRMRWSTFAVYNALGGVTWAVSVGAVAYALGASEARVLVAAGAIVLAAAIAVMLLAARRRRAIPIAGADDKPTIPPLTPGGSHACC